MTKTTFAKAITILSILNSFYIQPTSPTQARLSWGVPDVYGIYCEDGCPASTYWNPNSHPTNPNSVWNDRRVF